MTTILTAQLSTGVTVSIFTKGNRYHRRAHHADRVSAASTTKRETAARWVEAMDFAGREQGASITLHDEDLARQLLKEA